ncbi:MAG: hypothetical protein ACFBSC_13935 [Microcoleaceae cyanobacterium]
MRIFLRYAQIVPNKLSNYVGKNLQCLVEDPQFFFMRKIARLEIARQLMRLTYRQSKITETKYHASLLSNLDINFVAEQLHQWGCYTGLVLPQAVTQEILEFAQTHTCWGDRNPNLPFQLSDKTASEEQLGKNFMIGSYRDTHHQCPAIRKIIADPGLLEIASKYLGTPAVYVASELAWSFPTSSTHKEQLKAAQVFHYDIDDYACVKFFFYLTPVTETEGPHIYLLKSHKNKQLLHQLIGQRVAGIPDQLLERQYGPENVLTICGPAGSGFVEDIFGFHKGLPPRAGNRLLLQIEFATRTYSDIRRFERVSRRLS